MKKRHSVNKGNYTSELVWQYLDKYKEQLVSRKIGKLTLARIIYRENYDLFSDGEAIELERLRSLIRKHTGTAAVVTNSKVNFYLNNELAKSEILENLQQLPDSWANKPNKFVLPDGKYLTLSDGHIPYHHIDALEYAIQYGVKKEVTGILLNGDMMDMWQLSDFVQIGNNPSIADEIKIVIKFWQYLRERFPKIPIYYKMGNHEARWERYIWKKAPEIASMLSMEEGASLGLAKMIKLEAFGITYLADKTLIQAGDLSILHGHEFGNSFFSPVNPARGAFMRAKSSLLISHHHQTSEHSEGNLMEQQIDCYSLGCLCELAPCYRPFAYTKWNHGAAIVEVSGKAFEVDNFRIKV